MNDNEIVKKVQRKIGKQSPSNNYSIYIKNELSLKKNKKIINPSCY